MSRNIIMSLVVMTILFLGFQSSSPTSYSPSQAMAQKLDLSNLREIGNSDVLSDIDIQSMMEGDVQDILEKFLGLIPFTNNNNNVGAKPGQIGVLIYTHGHPGDPMHGHAPEKTEPIKEALERLGYPSEIVTHMPYTWDEGLAKLDEKGVKYVIFLYTDLFGPNSTVIHNVTRGIFGGIEEYKFCPGVSVGEDSCRYMGELTEPASLVSDAVLVFARPASPDDKTLREMFVEIARESNSEKNGNPENEIFVMVGHGARSNLNDMAQVEELTNAAQYVQQKIGYADAFGVTAREDWSDLKVQAVPAAVDQIEESLATNNANNVVLVPATGSGSGFDAVKEELDNRGIPYVETQEHLPIGSNEFTKWAQKNVLGTTAFIIKEQPTENTITPNWN